jgi:hypothetical protein
LTCKALYGSKEQVRIIISQLAPLEHLQLDISEKPPAGVLSVFPGSISTLRSLQLDRLVSRYDAVSQAALEQDIIGAISNLTNLRFLHTNLPHR